MKHGALIAEAAELFDSGWREAAVSSHLGVSESTARKWAYAYRALGKEALLSGERKTCSQQEKLEAVRLVLDDGLAKPQVMERMGTRSKTALERWVGECRKGGAGALAPKPRGRRAKPGGPVYASREEELEARARELKLELEIQKRINALADGIGQRPPRR